MSQIESSKTIIIVWFPRIEACAIIARKPGEWSCETKNSPGLFAGFEWSTRPPCLYIGHCAIRDVARDVNVAFQENPGTRSETQL